MGGQAQRTSQHDTGRGGGGGGQARAEERLPQGARRGAPGRRSPLRRILRWTGRLTAGLAALIALAWIALDAWIEATVLPDLDLELSVTVVDREGRLLRAYTVADGRWRLPVTLDEIDPLFIDTLIAYEDKRFWDHNGVDLLAMARAGWQLVTEGRIVSGASTITMQVARLLEEAPTGSIPAKIRQIRVALALERRLSKTAILTLYMRLAPYGGNIEGVRAASLSYFGKEPRRLTPAEAALLVALPQAPEARRPDRHAARARAARDRVLARVAAAGAIPAEDAEAARAERVPVATRPFPMLSPHLADRVRRAAPAQIIHPLAIDRDLQIRTERLARDTAERLPPELSLAIIVVDHATGEILASVGSPNLLDTRRQGFVDMTLAVRSPGSTLKPLIYGLGFEMGLAHPEMLIEDRPTAFGSYVPTNFDKTYRGTVSIREALQLSLNIPAIAMLDAVGPAHLMARLRRAGAEPVLPPGKAPGLAIGLGGIGVSLRDLVGVFAAIARGGEAVALSETPVERGRRGRQVLAPVAAWYVGNILVEAPSPLGSMQKGIAFKTGTSYGHRDAWAIGFDGTHVVGVWVGRPDAAAVPGALGLELAAPLLFETFGRIKTRPDPLGPPPGEALTVSHAELPPPMKRFRGRGQILVPEHPAPEIAFPPDGARVDLGLGAGRGQPLVVKLRDGLPPFTWLIDGAPVDAFPWDREIAWTPTGPGFVAISVIDARGEAARARIFVE